MSVKKTPDKKTGNKFSKKKTKPTQLKLTLLEKDAKMLKRYCSINKISQTTALKKIVREYLSENLTTYDTNIAKNQLDLFTSIQTNIFDEIAKKRKRRTSS